MALPPLQPVIVRQNEMILQQTIIAGGRHTPEETHAAREKLREFEAQRKLQCVKSPDKKGALIIKPVRDNQAVIGSRAPVQPSRLSTGRPRSTPQHWSYNSLRSTPSSAPGTSYGTGAAALNPRNALCTPPSAKSEPSTKSEPTIKRESSTKREQSPDSQTVDQRPAKRATMTLIKNINGTPPERLCPPKHDGSQSPSPHQKPYSDHHRNCRELVNLARERTAINNKAKARRREARDMLELADKEEAAALLENARAAEAVMRKLWDLEF